MPFYLINPICCNLFPNWTSQISGSLAITQASSTFVMCVCSPDQVQSPRIKKGVKPATVLPIEVARATGEGDKAEVTGPRGPFQGHIRGLTIAGEVSGGCCWVI